MSEINKAPLLVVAGVRNETSFGWSAAEAWLERDPNNEVLVTARGEKSVEFVRSQVEETNGRIDLVAPLDWTEESAADALYKHLTSTIGSDRRLGGLVHAVAWAPPENFTTSAHELPTEVYRQAMDATSFSLLNLVHGARENLADSAGIVTFGFGEHDRVYTEYGPALSTAKDSLSHLINQLGVSLGQETPSARTAEIATWFVPTYAGRGVLAGIGKQRGERVRPEQVKEYAAEKLAALKSADPDQQRINAGRIAVSFIADEMWSQTTGFHIPVDAGVPLRGHNIFPETNNE